MSKIKQIVIITIVIAVCIPTVTKAENESHNISTQWEGHTRPDKWEKARVFHTPIVQDSRHWHRIKERISISRIELVQDSQQKVFSPHAVYWYFTNEDLPEPRQYKSTFAINLFNERDYLVQLSFRDINKNYVKKVNWINEKLLYIQIWWGRVLGTYLIFDVEKEKIVYKEMVHDGGIPFLQWQQSKISNLFPQAYVLQCTQTVHCERIFGPAG